MAAWDGQLEICIEEAADTAGVREAGANRVELCRELWCGGLTPTDSEVLQAVKDAPGGGVRILVREREHGFALSDAEVDDLVQRIEHLRALTADSPVPVGFVVGSITAEEGGEINLEAARKFKVAAGDRAIVFHRAFDRVGDQLAALDQLVELGYQGVLTTGGKDAADPTQLRKLVDRAGGRIDIIASGGIRAHNARGIAAATRAPDIHMRAPLPGSARTDMELVAEIVRNVRGR